MKGIVIAAICVGILVVVDHQAYDGIYTGQVLQMFRQIGHGFGY